MSWESNRDKGKSINPWKRKNVLRRLKDSAREKEPITQLRWDLSDEREEQSNRDSEEANQ